MNKGEFQIFELTTKYRKIFSSFDLFSKLDTSILHRQGMSQYFVKVLNTQYQYFSKILLNTQYFNTFFHLKCIENTNTNINTQYFQFTWCTNTTLIFMYFCISLYLGITRDWFSWNYNCFSKFSSFKFTQLKANTNFPFLNLRKTQKILKWKVLGIGQRKWMYSIPIL